MRRSGLETSRPGPFGDAKGSFLSKSVNWVGKGKYKLRATLGAGDLKLQ